MAEDWLTVRQAAERMGRSDKWVYALLKRKDPRLAVQDRVGWEYRISASSIDQFKHRPRGWQNGHTKTTKRKRSRKALSKTVQAG